VDCGSKINVLSLCSGVGGLDLGIDIATNGASRTVCFVEREAFACAVLASRMADKTLAHAPIWSDLRTFDGKPWRGVVDIVTAGYPCQPFSTAGKRDGEADPRHLWPEVRRIISEVEPGLVFLENVAGHLSLGFDTVASDLQKLGYEVAAGLFTAEEVGASHRRERLFILGVADDASQYGEREMGSEKWEGLRASRDNCGAVADAFGINGTNREPFQSKEYDNRGRKLADAECDRSFRERKSWTKERTTIGSNGAKVGIFAPGPGERERWEDILAHRPDLAPATEPKVHRMADGVASRVDRLRAVGNGVVSICAAYAFVSLLARIERN